MIDLDDLAAGVAVRLQTIPGLRVWEEVPTRIVPPAAVVSIGEVQYDNDLDGSMRVEFRIMVLASTVDARNAQKSLRAYMKATGDASVKKALDDGPTCPVDGSATCAYAVIVGCDAPSAFEVAGNTYLGVEFSGEAVG